ncbi:MAG: response regulator transcription factor [Turicibacter sp.]|nr:response regulator transcription factor [Turicibacter sp.]
MYKILVIEDDESIASSLQKVLTLWGYDVHVATQFKDVFSEFVSLNPQLVLLDIGLPFFNGYHWCSEIRKVSNVPIMFLSSMSDNMNIVMAMNMGGDDFICKPCDASVIVAKVQALLRRSYSFSGQLNLIQHDGIILNLSDATLEYEGEVIELTKNEFKMLQLLLENVGKIVSREALMIRLWESDSFIDDNTLTVNMTRLRKRLAEIGLSDFVKTKKGLGYLVE